MKAYNVGKGILYRYPDGFSQSHTGLKIVEPFPSAHEGEGILKKATSSLPSSGELIFACSEPGCLSSFSTHKDLELHMDAAVHSKVLEGETQFDVIRKKWVSKLSEVPGSTLNFASSHMSPHDQESDNPPPRGWAVKTPKKKVRIAGKVKSYLTDKFNKGVNTGQKADAVAVANEMQVLRGNDGKLIFSPDQWKTHTQISSFFSRLFRVQKKRECSGQSERKEIDHAVELESERGDSESDNEDEDQVFQEIRETVYKAVDITHPIVYRGYNICDMVHRSTINKLKVQELKAICIAIGLECEGHPRRKATYIEPIKELVKCCCR